jgi:GTP-binding protein
VASRPQNGDDPRYRVTDARFVFGFQDIGSAPASAWPEIAFAGRSNVGKSSLMNTLMSRRALVRTSSTPGCTRQINVFEARLADGLTVGLCDLPGFGYARRAKTERVSWGPMIETYLREREALRLVVILVDVRRGTEEEEQMLVEYLGKIRARPVPFVFAATKLDTGPRSSASVAVADVARRTPGRVVGFSAQTGQGREELWRFLRAAVADPER